MSEEKNNSNLNEHSEPVAGTAQMPVGIMVILTLLGYIGCYKVDELNANFSARVHAPFGSADEVASLAPSEAELVLEREKYCMPIVRAAISRTEAAPRAAFPRWADPSG